MKNKYDINKGVNKPIEFRGLKGQYITYLAIGLLTLLLLFAILFIVGVPVYICLAFIIGAGALLFSTVFRYSNKHGVHGLLKEAAWRATPTVIRCRKRVYGKIKKQLKK